LTEKPEKGILDKEIYFSDGMQEAKKEANIKSLITYGYSLSSLQRLKEIIHSSYGILKDNISHF